MIRNKFDAHERSMHKIVQGARHHVRAHLEHDAKLAKEGMEDLGRRMSPSSPQQRHRALPQSNNDSNRSDDNENPEGGVPGAALRIVQTWQPWSKEQLPSSPKQSETPIPASGQPEQHRQQSASTVSDLEETADVEDNRGEGSSAGAPVANSKHPSRHNQAHEAHSRTRSRSTSRSLRFADQESPTDRSPSVSFAQPQPQPQSKSKSHSQTGSGSRRRHSFRRRLFGRSRFSRDADSGDKSAGSREPATDEGGAQSDAEESAGEEDENENDDGDDDDTEPERERNAAAAENPRRRSRGRSESPVPLSITPRRHRHGHGHTHTTSHGSKVAESSRSPERAENSSPTPRHHTPRFALPPPDSRDEVDDAAQLSNAPSPTALHQRLDHLATAESPTQASGSGSGSGGETRQNSLGSTSGHSRGGSLSVSGPGTGAMNTTRSIRFAEDTPFVRQGSSSSLSRLGQNGSSQQQQHAHQHLHYQHSHHEHGRRASPGPSSPTSTTPRNRIAPIGTPLGLAERERSGGNRGSPSDDEEGQEKHKSPKVPLSELF